MNNATNNVNGISSPVPQTQSSSPAPNQQSKSEDSDTSSNNENTRPKRLYISNIPFRFRDPDLRNMCSVCINFFFIIHTSIISYRND